ATFSSGKFVSEELPKCLLKEGCVKLKIMDDERYANDTCLGEVALSLKKIPSLDQWNKSVEEAARHQLDNPTGDQEDQKPDSQEVSDCSGFTVYTMFPTKEVISTGPRPL